jgi:transmembrane sensor
MVQENYLEIITRYLDGTATPEEAAMLLEWLKSDKLNTKLFIELKDIWLKTGLLNKEDQETERALYRFKSRVANTTDVINSQKFFLLKYANAASVAFIVVLIGILFFARYEYNTEKDKVTYTETIIPLGQKGQVLLGDGTRIALNSGSKIKYPSNFNSDKREVYVEGEAYFDVAHDETKPFLVHSGKLTVKVLGTSFNIKSYPGEDRIETTLVSGSVKIFQEIGKQEREITTLKPNEQAIYNTEDGKITVKQLRSATDEKLTSTKQDEQANMQKEKVLQIESVILWKEQKLIFENETLEEMARKLTRWYGKNIHIEDESLKRNRYSGKFIYNETIYQVLEVLSITTEIQYSEKNHEIYIREKK